MKARAPAIAPKAKSPSRRYFAALETLEPRLLLSSTPTPAQTIAQSDNQFAFDLFNQLASTSAGGNVFFSPYSIATALQMTLQGANGQTAAQMIQALHLPDADVAQAGIQALYQLFQANPSTAGYTLSTANRLWVEQNFQLLQSFLDSEQSTFGAAPQSVDFSDPNAAAATINQWVSDQTNGKIPDLIPATAINDLTRLIITNAIYFKGTWLDSFNPAATQQANFTTAPGQTSPVQMMNQLNDFGYYAQSGASGFQAIDLPYEGNSLDMLVILPTDPNLADFDPSLTPDLLNQITSGLQNQNVNLYFPRFELSETYDLASPLENLGITDAFGPNADFSGITDSEPLQISQVIHQATIQVDEQGSEAAGATGVVITTTATVAGFPPAMPTVFDADHPFIIAIRDRSTGTILFMGQITNPGNDTDGESSTTGTNPPGLGPLTTPPPQPTPRTPLQPPVLTVPNPSAPALFIAPPSTANPAGAPAPAAMPGAPSAPSVPAGNGSGSAPSLQSIDLTPMIPTGAQPGLEGAGVLTISSYNIGPFPTSGTTATGGTTINGGLLSLNDFSPTGLGVNLTVPPILTGKQPTTPIVAVSTTPTTNPTQSSNTPIIQLGTGFLNTGTFPITLAGGSLTSTSPYTGSLTLGGTQIVSVGTQSNGTIVIVLASGGSLTLNPG